MIRLQGGWVEGLRISQWLQDQGLKHEIDYYWHPDYKHKQVIFFCKNESVETLIALRWL